MPYLPPARVADVSVAAVFTASPALVAVPWFAVAPLLPPLLPPPLPEVVEEELLLLLPPPPPPPPTHRRLPRHQILFCRRIRRPLSRAFDSYPLKKRAI